mmetsp:Transcript_1173/g.1542  ORF Transcript_1173/g.1542 Transcript_1173/m.1542 type:complete len:98 (-) Transcript_1173:180-473(-)
MYDDHSWLPYGQSNISVTAFSFSGRMQQLYRVVDSVLRVNSSQLKERLDQVKKARKFYTYEGVLQQIDLFFRDPLGPNGGYLRCQRVPDRDHFDDFS